MKLKYYLRGLGIGIVVSVCVLSAAFGNRAPMTDAEIKERAAELGMIENTIIKDMANKEDNELIQSDDEQDEEIDVDNNNDAENTDGDDTNVEETVEGSEEVNSDESTDEPVDESEETMNENTQEQQKDLISITVVSGDSSWTVSKRMEEAGLIESAKDFDTYLCGYGYDKKISVGTYKIPIGSSYEDMAKILTKMD